MKTIYAYTDGSVFNNQRRESIRTFGGIGVFFGENDSRNVSKAFFQFPITNQRTEIKAVSEAIESVMQDKKDRGDDSRDKLVIYSDSQYVINLITKWIHKWKYNQWKTVNGKPVLNKDLIFELDHLIQLYKDFIEMEFRFVKAHRTSPPADKNSSAYKMWYGNYMADKLAKRGTTLAMTTQQIQVQV